jgi:hypothetical protein
MDAVRRKIERSPATFLVVVKKLAAVVLGFALGFIAVWAASVAVTELWLW